MSPTATLLAAFALVLGACRVNFDAREDGDAGPGSDGNDALTDMTPPMGVPRTFCERPGVCDVSGVTADTTLTNVSPVFNFGVLNEVAVTDSSDDLEFFALRFDVSSIDVGTMIEGATLELYVKNATDEILGPIEANPFARAWAEGLENGTTASGATWQRADIGVDWTTQGGDISSFVVAGGTPPGVEQAFVLTLDTATVQGWVDSPATNFGLRLGARPESGEVHWHFRSKEEVAQGPILTVYLRE